MSLVVIIGASLKGKNGVNRVISEMSKYLNEKAVVITDQYIPDIGYKISNKTRIIETGYTGHTGAPLNLLRLLREIVEITALISIHKKVILNPHTFAAVFLSSYFKILFFMKKIRIIAFVYDREDISWLRRFTFSYFKLKWILRLGFIEKILVLDSKMAKLVSKNLATARIHIIRIGVPSSLIWLYDKISGGDFSPPVKLHNILASHPGAFKIFFHGILIPRRRVEDLLVALNMVIENHTKDIILYIGGSMDYDPSYVNYLLCLKKKLKLDSHVYFLGPLSDDELAYAYHMTDAFVFPCDNQTWGLAPLEAMLFEKPVIVSTGSGVSEVLDENVALLVPPKDPISLKNSIVELLFDKELRKRLGINARKYILATLTFKNTVDNFLKILDT